MGWRGKSYSKLSYEIGINRTHWGVLPSGAIAGSFDKQHIASIFQPERGKGHYWFSVLLSEIINKLYKWCVVFQEYFKYFTRKLKMKQRNKMNKQKTDTNVLPVLCWFKRVFHRACLCERTKRQICRLPYLYEATEPHKWRFLSR